MNVTFFMVTDEQAHPVAVTLAANLRRLRIARHLSLSELARATTVSKATLSSIENGRANPTIETLAALASALRVELSELLEEPPLETVTVVRRAQGRFEQHAGAERRRIDTLPGGAGDVSELLVPARHVHEEPAQAPGDRWGVYVLEGKLITGPVEQATELGPNDYAGFPADVPAVFETSGKPARALVARTHRRPA
jgi:transcriptional regulator with XRE-family HTH domain